MARRQVYVPPPTDTPQQNFRFPTERVFIPQTLEEQSLVGPYPAFSTSTGRISNSAGAGVRIRLRNPNNSSVDVMVFRIWMNLEFDSSTDYSVLIFRSVTSLDLSNTLENVPRTKLGQSSKALASIQTTNSSIPATGWQWRHNTMRDLIRYDTQFVLRESEAVDIVYPILVSPTGAYTSFDWAEVNLP